MVKPTQRNQIRSVRFVCSFSTHAPWNVMNFRCNIWTIRNFTMNDVTCCFMSWFQSITLMFKHWFWNPEINLHICPQLIWNICCTTHVVFLLFYYRIGIFFSWSFVIPSWLFNIFHIWNSMFWCVFWWTQCHQVVFLWFRRPFINKKTIKKKQSKPNCKNWKINGNCKIDSCKNQSLFIVRCWISKCFLFWKSNKNVFFHSFAGLLYKTIILYFYFLQFQVFFTFLFDKFYFFWLFMSYLISGSNFWFVRNRIPFFKTNLCLKITTWSTRIIQPHIICFIWKQLTQSFFTKCSNRVFVEHCFLHECFNNCNITGRSFKP